MADEADALSTMKTLISAGWTAGNTDNITPQFPISTEQSSRLDYNMQTTHVLFFLVSHTTEPNGLGPSHREKTVDRVSLDIRTKKGRDHLRKVYNEIRRIISTNINSPDSNFLQLIPIGFTDFSSIGFHRYVYDVYLRNWTVVR